MCLSLFMPSICRKKGRPVLISEHKYRAYMDFKWEKETHTTFTFDTNIKLIENKRNIKSW